ncbi:uncharacterized protein [Coffea arabica]|uniref:RNase H type-1 domain-containing protein n=1 Tax=Coffea arabica TaxID=13443 RepID=A0A6P6SRQ9_COFAR|nr:uncharacterized protein LOC113693968 [Coffea arabica]
MVEHILFHCAQAQKVWKLAPVQWDSIQTQTGCFKQWWTALIQARSRKEGKQHIALTANILWQLWKDRNELEFEGKEKDGIKVVQKASNEWMEFEEAGTGKEARSTSEIDAADARQREEGMEVRDLMELHIATQKATEGHKMGIGVVAKLNGTRIIADWVLVDRTSLLKIQDEAAAMRLALIKVRQLGWNRIKVINANQHLIAMLKSGKGDNLNTVTLVEDILALANLFQMCFFEVGKNSNMSLCQSISRYALSIVLDEERIFVSS